MEEDITAELESWKTESSKTKSRNEVSYAVTPLSTGGMSALKGTFSWVVFPGNFTHTSKNLVIAPTSSTQALVASRLVCFPP